MSFVRQRNECSPREGALRTCACPYRCQKTATVTGFVRHHPFRSDVEIRRCFNCGRQAFFPTGSTFKTLESDQWQPMLLS